MTTYAAPPALTALLRGLQRTGDHVRVTAGEQVATGVVTLGAGKVSIAAPNGDVVQLPVGEITEVWSLREAGAIWRRQQA